MRTNADAPDPIAAATAIVLSAATRTPAYAQAAHGIPGPVAAMGTGIILAVAAITAMMMSTSATPLWCTLTSSCQ